MQDSAQKYKSPGIVGEPDNHRPLMKTEAVEAMQPYSLLNEKGESMHQFPTLLNMTVAFSQKVF